SCQDACAETAQQHCEGVLTFSGACEAQDITGQDLFGFSASQCVCEVEYNEGDASCTWGDPHIRTYDGLKYSPQVAGEFIASKSDDSSLNVQVRQEPFISDCPWVAFNTAAAAQVGGRKVSVYVGRSPNLYVDDEPVRLLGEYLDLGGGNYIRRHGDDYRIVSAEGDSILITANTWNLRMTVAVPKSRAGTVNGVMGNINGDHTDDLQDVDGNV